MGGVEDNFAQFSTHVTEPKANRDTNNTIATTITTCGLSTKANFGNLDTRTSQDILLAIAETKEMFPELKIEFVGSTQSRNAEIEADLRENYLSAYRQHYPGVSDTEFLPLVNQQVAEDLACLDIGDDTIAQSLYVPNSATNVGVIISRYNGITINEKYGSNYDYFKQVKQSDVSVGWKPVKCDTPKATVDHELGHQLAKLVDAHNDSSIKAMFNKFSTLNAQGQTSVLSGYAATSIHEFIAESWSEYRNNPNCRPMAKLVANRILDLYDAKSKL